MNFKKEIAIALMGMVSLAAAQEVVTLGTFGFQKVDIPPAGGVNLVGFSFTSSDPLYLEDVFGADQLTQSSFSSLADKIHIWNGAGYDTYFQKPDGLFYDFIPPSPVTNVVREIKSGMALWLQSSNGASTTNSITFSGAVLVTDSESQVYAGGWETIANPYPTQMDMSSTNFVDFSTATAHAFSSLADKLYIWNPNQPGGGGYDGYFLHSSRKWYGIISGGLESAIIPAGGGAFYDAKNGFTSDVFKPF